MLWIDRKYISLVSSQLRNFKWKTNDTATCSCPICGDSKTDTRKARGYFYVSTKSVPASYRFFCHNKGCSANVTQLLTLVSPAYSDEYRLECLKERSSAKVPPKIETKIVAKPRFKKAESNLESILSLDDSHVAVKYVRSRSIPVSAHPRIFWAADFAQYVESLVPGKHKLRAEPRLCMLMRDKNNDVFGVIGRSLDPQSEMRYLTIKLDPNALKLYGAESANCNKVTFLTEGAIDSFFLPNCVALCGQTIDLEELKLHINPQQTIVCLDNEPRNKVTVDKMIRFAQAGYSVCVWEGMSTELKDINKMAMAGYSGRVLLTYIAQNTHRGLAALNTINNWKLTK